MKLGIVFPGQGAQYIGMGKEIYENFPELQKYYDIANELLGYDLKKIVFEGPQEILVQTNYTQPAVFLTSFVCYKALELKLPEIKNLVEFVAGHSLGEYTAVCISGAISFEDGIQIVSTRGKIMSEISQHNPGGMIAVLGLSRDEISNICKELQNKGLIVEPVNFNSPGQVVVAGSIEGINELSNLLNNKGIKNIKLNVSGAFHSSLMDEAQKIFSSSLDKLNLNNAFIKIVMNYDGKPHLEKEEIIENLKLQINHPVLWEDTITYMINSGVELFIECGPGKVLSGLIKKISKQSKIVNVENLSSLEDTVKSLSGVK